MKRFLLEDGFMDFITGNGIWILVGCLAFALLVSVLFLVLNIEKEKKARANNAAKKVVKEETPKERVKPVEVNIAKKEDEVAKVEEPAAQEEKVEEVVEEPASEGEEAGNYEINYDAENKQWVVRRENSLRATKRTKTKQEAIDFAKPLADKHEVKLIVHTKKD